MGGGGSQTESYQIYDESAGVRSVQRVTVSHDESGGVRLSHCWFQTGCYYIRTKGNKGKDVKRKGGVSRDINRALGCSFGWVFIMYLDIKSFQGSRGSRRSTGSMRH